MTVQQKIRCGLPDEIRVPKLSNLQLIANWMKESLTMR